MPIELRYLYSFGGRGKVQTGHSVPALEDGAFAMLTRRIVQIPSFIALSPSPVLAWAAGGTGRVVGNLITAVMTMKLWSQAYAVQALTLSCSDFNTRGELP